MYMELVRQGGRRTRLLPRGVRHHRHRAIWCLGALTLAIGLGHGPVRAQEIDLNFVKVAFGEPRTAVDERLTGAGVKPPIPPPGKKRGPIDWLPAKGLFLHYDRDDRLSMIQAQRGFDGKLGGIAVGEEASAVKARMGEPTVVPGRFAEIQSIYRTADVLVHPAIAKDTGRVWLVSIASRTFVPNFHRNVDLRAAGALAGSVLIDALCIFGPDTRARPGIGPEDRNGACTQMRAR